MKKLQQYDPKAVVFFDIETAPIAKHFVDLTPEMRAAFRAQYAKEILAESGDQRATKNEIFAATEIEKVYQANAPLNGCFARVVCVSIGWYQATASEATAAQPVEYRGEKLYYGSACYKDANEIEILKKVAIKFNNANQKGWSFCGHAIKVFDVPLLAHRFLINGMKIPKPLDNYGSPPWEQNHLIDTSEAWKFGIGFIRSKLAAVAPALGIPTPKDDIDGSQVGAVYWSGDDGAVERIATYCDKDTATQGVLFLRLRG